MLTIDPKRMTSHAFDRKADPEWAALADYLREAAAAGAVVRLTARPETLTLAQAAARLGTSRSTIARRIKSGEITAVRVGTHYRIPAREFERFRDAVLGAMISDVSADLEADVLWPPCRLAARFSDRGNVTEDAVNGDRGFRSQI